ncbi:MAG: hypothetical protein N3A57_07010, partial [Negativicutes bacterium]|nr:hypothetical protein [Negativicutes bacterium]
GIALCDDEGVFAVPPADPLRSLVTLKTTAILLVVLPQKPMSAEDVGSVLNFAAGMLIGYNRGEIAGRGIFSRPPAEG